MKQSRLFVLLAVVALAAMVAAPAVASAALLTNEWGQQFAGRAVCLGCHASTFDATTHGTFAQSGASVIPSSGQPGMWPAGLLSGGQQLASNQVAFRLGSGSGPTEWLFWNPTMAANQKDSAGTLVADPATGPFAVVEGLEWNPDNVSFWNYTDVRGLWYANYTCSQCHQLGVVRKGIKPNAAANTNGATGTVDAWSKFSADATTTLASWIPGSSIQCERCHGTGMTASPHFTTGVGIVGFNSPTAASKKILDSQVCGQCHASFKSGNVYGFTPDTTISAYVTQYTQADVPTVASFTANPSAYKFFPNGENQSLKHVYYTEWAMSAHSIRGALTSSSPNATPYQKLGTSHFTNTLGGVLCNRCHTGEGYLKRKGATIMASFVETATSEGFYGQECAVCHVAHGAATPNGMGVRTPETANGAYSTNGLNIDNQSICEDCHNWQAEVLGQPIVPASTGRGPSHPQREVFHGRAFFETPTAPDFMPGAKCEFCHMPATRTDFPGETLDDRYGTRDFKRFSHRMFVMKPGNAQAWGLAVGQDSCTQCHAGSTRTDLQASLDGWQATAASMDTTLKAEITAAKARPEASGNGAYLVSVAYTNEAMFVNDSSGGAHNPPYIQAALKRSTEIAKSVGGSFALVQGPSTNVLANSLNAISGRIVNGDGSGAANGNLTLLVGGSPVGTTVSDANGNFSFTVAPAATTLYEVRWQRSANAVTVLNSTLTINVGPAALLPTTITIARSTSSVLLNRQFTLSGVVTPVGTVGLNMHVDVKKPGSPRFSYSSARTIYASGGQALWLYKYIPRIIRGTYQFKAVFDANATYAGSSSGIVTVLVR